MMDIDIVYLVCVLTSVLLSMTLHEAMHAFVGYWLGDHTAKVEGRLTLNPLAHIDPLMTIILPLMLAVVGAPPFGAAKPVPFNPMNLRYGEWGAALVALAGPLTNFILAFIGFGLLALNGTTDIIGVFLTAFVFVNLGFFVFNMLPLPPLDGSRVLYAVAPEPLQRLMETMERYGIILIFAIVLLFNSALGTLMSTAIRAILRFFSQLFGVNLVL